MKQFSETPLLCLRSSISLASLCVYLVRGSSTLDRRRLQRPLAIEDSHRRGPSLQRELWDTPSVGGLASCSNKKASYG